MLIPNNKISRVFIREKHLPYEIKTPPLLGNDKIFLFTMLSIFILISTYKIDTIPALFDDEALPGLIAKQILDRENFEPGWIANQSATTGPNSTYIVMIFFLIFGVNILSLRISTIFVSIISLIASYLFLKHAFGSKIARLSMILQTFLPGFIIISRIGGAAPTFDLLPISMILYSSYKWFQTRNIKFLYVTSLMIGLGIGFHIIFFYFLMALLISVTVLKIGFIRISKRHIFYFILITILSLLPYGIWQLNFIIFQINNPTTYEYDYNLLNHLLLYSATSSEGFSNTNFMENLGQRILLLMDYLSGGSDFYICNYTLRNFLTPVLFLLSQLFLIFFVIRKSKVSKESFVLLLFFIILIEISFTTSWFIRIHFFLMVPILFLIMVLGLNKVINISNLSIIVLLLTTINFLIMVDYYSCLETVGGNPLFSDQMYNLLDYLENSSARRFVFLEWGLSSNLPFLSDDPRLSPENITSFKLSYLDESDWFEVLRDEFKNDTLFILPIMIYEYYYLEEDFPRFVGWLGRDILIETEFNCTDEGKYIVYSIN